MKTKAILTALPASVWNLSVRLGDPAKDIHEQVMNLYYSRKIKPKKPGEDVENYDTVWAPI